MVEPAATCASGDSCFDVVVPPGEDCMLLVALDGDGPATYVFFDLVVSSVCVGAAVDSERGG